MTDADRRELLYFATGSPVHPHDFGGLKLTVHVKSDTSKLPWAMVRRGRAATGLRAGRACACRLPPAACHQLLDAATVSLFVRAAITASAADLPTFYWRCGFVGVAAQVCTLELNVPFYQSQAELTRKLLTAFKCET